MPLSLSGSGGITYPDGSVNTSRSISSTGDVMTGPLSVPSITGLTPGAGISAAALSGRIAKANSAIGSVVQVVYATNTTLVSLNTATAGQGVFYDTGTNAVITPTTTGSRILVLVDQSYFHDSGGAQGTGFRIMRNGLEITTEQGFSASYLNPNRVHGYHSMNVIDSPNTTSAVTYKVRGAQWGNTGDVQFQYGATQSPSRIVLMEII